MSVIKAALLLEYPIGCRVRALTMNFGYLSIPYGTDGIVEYIDDTGYMVIDWGVYGKGVVFSDIDEIIRV